jgi:cyclic pyranopterin phosphate synthase
MLTHIDNKGNAKIVDISGKKVTVREAIASGKIIFNEKSFNQIKLENNKKGDILTVSKIAGIMSAKNMSNIIPLCHPIKIEDILINFEINEEKKDITVSVKVKSQDKTGVEMEALGAVSVCLLTIYDMCKAVDKKMIISDIKLLKKTGGKENYLKIP